MKGNEKQEQKPIRSEMTQKQEFELTRQPLPPEFIKRLQENVRDLERRLSKTKK